MDKNALTEQRRETVIGLLKGMNIKKSNGEGFDKDDVYECMQKLCDLYEKNIEDLENAYESEIIALKDKYQKYDDNNELYVSLIMEAKKSSNEIINQAKSEVETILAEGREQVAKQESELEQMRIGIDAEKQAINEELNAARQAVEAEKAAMKAELEAEKEKVSALKNKYNQQLNAMEEEFAEIKTNILRTAGKMDSLKSKLPDEEAISWDIADAANAVDFPVSEIEVDDVLEVAPAEEIAPEKEAEEPAAEAAPEPVASEETSTYEEASAETGTTVTLEDLIAEPAAKETAPANEIPEINFDNIEVDLPDLKEESAPADDSVDEISFEGLEDLFKEDK